MFCYELSMIYGYLPNDTIIGILYKIYYIVKHNTTIIWIAVSTSINLLTKFIKAAILIINLNKTMH